LRLWRGQFTEEAPAAEELDDGQHEFVVAFFQREVEDVVVRV
jgi:hypothetical protein